ncbi:MAG: hypothetical protein H9W81_07930 [Enterococcus sp.]|nr:hypothetical protein [Enterococcus sp.]
MNSTLMDPKTLVPFLEGEIAQHASLLKTLSKDAENDIIPHPNDIDALVKGNQRALAAKKAINIILSENERNLVIHRIKSAMESEMYGSGDGSVPAIQIFNLILNKLS